MKYAMAILLAIIEVFFSVFEIIFTTIAGTLAIIRVRLFQDYNYLNWLKRDLRDCQSILELGCGSNSPILKIGYGKKTDAVDIWQPYVDKHNKAKDYNRCSQADILTMKFGQKDYDAIVICDVLEHLPYEQANQIQLLARIETAARKKVILFTPNGFVENDQVDGDPYQRHLSAWEPIDYSRRGYKVRGATGLRYVLGKASLPKYRPYSIFSIIAMVSQPVIFNHPEWAWHSYAVRDVK